MDYRQKLRAIRKAEGLTQKQLSEITGISHSAIRNYESGSTIIGLSVIERFVSTPQLSKYTLWLMTDQTAPESGQTAPAAEFLDEDAKRKKSIN
ncbi:helix-turn-helix transcriptional regulator [Salmonella enterica subsp. enterica serovar Durham]|nr:helix-turn-helix transcriptional regulator [Salmonella enterica subsp. enterica serovar Durham]EIB9803770.1 helix-turn-helix transcriptional regulator [Salmonella enterica subsp. enterica serovar Durham]